MSERKDLRNQEDQKSQASAEQVSPDTMNSNAAIPPPPLQLKSQNKSIGVSPALEINENLQSGTEGSENFLDTRQAKVTGSSEHYPSTPPPVQMRDEEIIFSDDEADEVVVATYDLGTTGKRPYDVIQDHVSSVTATLMNMKGDELSAINNFLTAMVFESWDATQADPLGAIFKAVGSELWSAAVGSIPAVGGIPASSIINVVTAMADEMKRAAEAQSSFDLGTYIQNLRQQVSDGMSNTIATFQLEERRNLEQRFTEAEGTYTEGNRNVTGAKAAMLRGLETSAAAFIRAKPSELQYENSLIRKWITDRRAGGRGTTEERFGPFGSIHSNGQIELKYDTERNDDGSYDYEFESAKLYTSTRAGRAASLFTRLMRSQGRKVYEMGVPIVVLLETEGLTPGGRSYYSFRINSRTSYQRSHWHGPANAAWQAMPWAPIDNVTRVTGGG